jgi:SHS2 domain-containing protein
MNMKYEIIDHTADFGLHVYGCDERDLFSNAAMAMFDMIADGDMGKGSKIFDVQVTGDDWPDLMVNWLRELLYLWAGKELLVKRIDIVSISAYEVKAKAFVDPYNAKRHIAKNEIKAVTYHQIRVSGGPSGWEAKIIFDV